MVQAQVLDLLTGLVRELGVGLVIISHDLSVLVDHCDRIAVMYAGRVVEQGPSARGLRPAPLHPYARALSAAFPTIGDHAARYAPRGLPGRPARPGDLPGGLLVPPALPGRRCRCAAPRTSACAPCGPGHEAACVHVRAPEAVR